MFSSTNSSAAQVERDDATIDDTDGTFSILHPGKSDSENRQVSDDSVAYAPVDTKRAPSATSSSHLASASGDDHVKHIADAVRRVSQEVADAGNVPAQRQEVDAIRNELHTVASRVKRRRSSSRSAITSEVDGNKTLEAKTGEAKTGEAKTGEADTGEADTGEADTGEADTGEADTGEADTGEADTGEADTGEADTSEADTSEADPGEADHGEAELLHAPDETPPFGVEELNSPPSSSQTEKTPSRSARPDASDSSLNSHPSSWISRARDDVVTAVGTVGRRLTAGVEAGSQLERDAAAAVHTQVEATSRLVYGSVFFVIKVFLLGCIAAYTFTLNTARCACAANVRKPLLQWGSVLALVMAVVALVYPTVYAEVPALKVIMLLVTVLVVYGVITYFPLLRAHRCRCARPNDWRRWVVEYAVYVVLLLFLVGLGGVSVL